MICANLRLLARDFSEIFYGEILRAKQDSMTVHALAALRPFYSFKFDFRWSRASHFDASRGNRVCPIANSYEINKLG